MQLQPTLKGHIVTELYIDGQPTIRIGGGHSRQVFKFSNYYIKFDNPAEHSGDVGIQSRLELEFIAKIKPEDRKYFCLPVAYGEIKGLYYVVQKEVEHTRYPSVIDKEIFQRLKNRYWFRDVHLPNRNCVTTDDGFMIYDYAPVHVGQTAGKTLAIVKKVLPIADTTVKFPTEHTPYLWD